jgi:hypothetical protein
MSLAAAIGMAGTACSSSDSGMKTTTASSSAAAASPVSGGGGGGGATYTGTNGPAYGVFDGGGYEDKTWVDVCAWPAKPSERGRWVSPDALRDRMDAEFGPGVRASA